MWIEIRHTFTKLRAMCTGIAQPVFNCGVTHEHCLNGSLVTPVTSTHRRYSWYQCSRPRTNIYTHRPGLGTCRHSCISHLHSRRCLHRQNHMKTIGEGVALSKIHYYNFHISTTSAVSNILEGNIPYQIY